MSRRTELLLTALLALCAGPARADDAPFGLHWGPVTTVPRPAKVDREGNITALYYRQGMPPAVGPDIRARLAHERYVHTISRLSAAEAAAAALSADQPIRLLINTTRSHP